MRTRILLSLVLGISFMPTGFAGVGGLSSSPAGIQHLGELSLSETPEGSTLCERSMMGSLLKSNASETDSLAVKSHRRTHDSGASSASAAH